MPFLNFLETIWNECAFIGFKTGTVNRVILDISCELCIFSGNIGLVELLDTPFLCLRMHREACWRSDELLVPACLK